jgi:hypothetical protein
MLICTTSTANHLPKAACLARSLSTTQPDHTMLLCLAERDRTAIGQLGTNFTHVVLASELGLPHFESLMFRYIAFEACTAIKAQLFLWALESFPEEQEFLFLDADVMAYSRFEELEFVFPRAEIILTPHHVQDEYSYERTWDNMLRTLLCGVFNSGFVALRRSQAALAFLKWWNDKLSEYCRKDESCGLFFDQRWLDAALAFFDVTVFREPGYHVANWNIASRCLSSSPRFGYLVNGRPLRFFHFSMVDSGRDLYYFRKHLPRDNPVFGLRDRYVQEIKQLDAGGHSRIPWSYEFYHSGERISADVRRAYRELPELSTKFSDPFAQSNSAMNCGEAVHRPG